MWLLSVCVATAYIMPSLPLADVVEGTGFYVVVRCMSVEIGSNVYPHPI